MQYEGYDGNDGYVTHNVSWAVLYAVWSARCSMNAMVVMMAIFWVNVSKVVLALYEGYDGYDDYDGHDAD